MNETGLESTTDTLHPEDLLALERRRELTDHERRRLGMCLAASDGLRLLRQLHADFESQDIGCDNEASMTESCVTAAKQRFARSNVADEHPRFRGRMILIGASAFMLTMVASAAVVRWKHRHDGVPVAPSIAVPMHTPKASSSTTAASTPKAATRVETDATADGEVTNHAVEARLASTVPAATGTSLAPHSSRGPDLSSVPTTTTAETKTANELFSAANAARRSGETQTAVDLYLRLQAKFPSSDEALISHVLLARLDLGRGALTQALHEFDAYLDRAPRGSLAEEALQGKAQTLSRLGRSREEAATWQRLLREFPNSVYARSAHQHLTEGSH